jgi:Helix-hairpin-helix motif
MPLDLTQPVKTSKLLVGEHGNNYPPAVYRPGELPPQYLTEEFCHNVGVAAVHSPIAGANIQPIALELQTTEAIPAISKAVNHDLIDINTADIGKIMEVKGIGTSLANAIVIERDSKGSFKDVADLVSRIEKLIPLTTTIENRFSFSVRE